MKFKIISNIFILQCYAPLIYIMISKSLNTMNVCTTLESTKECFDKYIEEGGSNQITNKALLRNMDDLVNQLKSKELLAKAVDKIKT